MGKIKHRRLRGNRFNPAAIDANLVVNEPGISTDMPPNGLRLILEKLDSVVVEEKMTALNSLGAISLDPTTHETLVKHIGKVAVLLHDPSIMVRLAATGALRNLSAGGSEDIVNLMVQQEVLTPLVKLLNEFQGNWHQTPLIENDLVLPTIGNIKGEDGDPRASIYIHATHLLWNLCELNEEALDIFNQEGLVHILLQHLEPAVWGYSIAVTSAQCLLCVSENNSSAASAIISVIESLMSFASCSSSSAIEYQYAMTISGILLNVNSCSKIVQLVLGTIEQVLVIDALDSVVQYAQRHQAGSESVQMLIGFDLQSPEDIENILTAQQIALESLTNICFPEDDNWEDCEDFMADDDLVEENCDTKNTDEMDINGESKNLGSSFTPEVYEGIKNLGLFMKVIEKFSYPDDEVINKLLQLKRHGPSLVSKLSMLRMRACQAIENLVVILGQEEMISQPLFSIWTCLGNSAFKSPLNDGPLLESATGAMRAIMDRLKSTAGTNEHIADVSQKDLQIIFEVGQASKVANVRSNLARMVGVFACLKVSHSSQNFLNNDLLSTAIIDVTEYLLNVAANDDQLWVSAEALDVIIDIYSDDKTDFMAFKCNLISRLNGIKPLFKSKHQQQKKQLGEYRALVLTVKDNLESFIKYKSSRIATLSHGC